MHARLPSSAGVLLIAAISGRALAAAARRAGYRPLVADLFCDTDTVALAERAVKSAGRSAERHRWGAADRRRFGRLRAKNSPWRSSLDRASNASRNSSTRSAASFRWRAIAEQRYAASKTRSRLPTIAPHWAFRIRSFGGKPPPDPRNWVAKTVGGAGGHTCEAGRRNRRRAPQAAIFSGLYAAKASRRFLLADGKRAQIVGFSRQWTSPAPTAPYRYGGAVRLRRFDRRETAMIDGWLSGLADRAGLLGLCSADFIRAEDGFWLVEINPRPGATLDIFDSPEAPLMEVHLQCRAGQCLYRLPRFADCMASMITYAADPIPHFPALDWPDWTADRQSEGTSSGRRRSGLHGLRARPERGSDTENAREAGKAIAELVGRRRAVKDGSAFLNDNAQRIAEGMIRDAERLRISAFEGLPRRDIDRRRRKGNRQASRPGCAWPNARWADWAALHW